MTIVQVSIKHVEKHVSIKHFHVQSFYKSFYFKVTKIKAMGNQTTVVQKFRKKNLEIQYALLYRGAEKNPSFVKSSISEGELKF